MGKRVGSIFFVCLVLFSLSVLAAEKDYLDEDLSGDDIENHSSPTTNPEPEIEVENASLETVEDDTDTESVPESGQEGDVESDREGTSSSGLLIFFVILLILILFYLFLRIKKRRGLTKGKK